MLIFNNIFSDYAGEQRFSGLEFVFKVPEGVTRIERKAFAGNENIAEVVLPESVKTIGERAFAHSRIRKTTFNGVIDEIEEGAFKDCARLAEIEIPKGVKVIERDTFKGCENLERIDLPEGIEIIRSGAFDNCTKLKGIEIKPGILKIDGYAFSRCSSLEEAVIADGIKEIGTKAFEGCKSLAKLTLPPHIEEMGDDAFKGTAYLNNAGDFGSVAGVLFEYKGSDEDVRVPEGITDIRETAFKDNRRLKRITIPEGVKIICAECFKGCINLEEVSLPGGLEGIHRKAFADCVKLKKASCLKSLRYVASWEPFSRISPFYKSLGDMPSINGYLFACRKIEDEVIIPDGVKKICSGAIYNYDLDISRIVIPESVDVIDRIPFRAYNIDEIVMPEKLRKYEELIMSENRACRIVYY